MPLPSAELVRDAPPEGDAESLPPPADPEAAALGVAGPVGLTLLLALPWSVREGVGMPVEVLVACEVADGDTDSEGERDGERVLEGEVEAREDAEDDAREEPLREADAEVDVEPVGEREPLDEGDDDDDRLARGDSEGELLALPRGAEPEAVMLAEGVVLTSMLREGESVGAARDGELVGEPAPGDALALRDTEGEPLGVTEEETHADTEREDSRVRETLSVAHGEGLPEGDAPTVIDTAADADVVAVPTALLVAVRLPEGDPDVVAELRVELLLEGEPVACVEDVALRDGVEDSVPVALPRGLRLLLLLTDAQPDDEAVTDGDMVVDPERLDTPLEDAKALAVCVGHVVAVPRPLLLDDTVFDGDIEGVGESDTCPVALISAEGVMPLEAEGGTDGVAVGELAPVRLGDRLAAEDVLPHGELLAVAAPREGDVDTVPVTEAGALKVRHGDAENSKLGEPEPLGEETGLALDTALKVAGTDGEEVAERDANTVGDELALKLTLLDALAGGLAELPVLGEALAHTDAPEELLLRGEALADPLPLTEPLP